MTKKFQRVTRFLFFAALFLFSNHVFSQQNSAIATARSAEFPLSAQAADENIAIQIIDITEASLDYFYRMMGSSKDADIVCSYIWRNDVDQKVEDVFPSVLKVGKGFEIRGYGDLKDEQVQETLIRTSMIVFLQSLAASKKKFQNGQEIAYPPMWVVEGLTQGMYEGRHEKYEQIVKRMAAVRKTPSLKTVQGWKDFSSNKTERFWQQAFCYWLLDRTTQTVAGQGKLREWIQNKLSDPACSDYLTEADERKWQQNQEPAERALMMTWEDSCTQLDEILGEKDFGQHVRKLTELQMHAHFLLQEAIGVYVEAYSLDGENRDSKMAEARKLRGDAEFAMQCARQRLDDILMNYAVDGEKEKTMTDDEILEKYAHKPVDDIFTKRLNLYEMKMRDFSRN